MKGSLVERDSRRAGEQRQHIVSIGGDGRWVASASGASNLVSDDTNGMDVFCVSIPPGTTYVQLGFSAFSAARRTAFSSLVAASVSSAISAVATATSASR